MADDINNATSFLLSAILAWFYFSIKTPNTKNYINKKRRLILHQHCFIYLIKELLVHNLTQILLPLKRNRVIE